MPSRKLTKEAREYCSRFYRYSDRENVVQVLEGIGIQCYDDEPLGLLAEAAVVSVEDGDIEFDWSQEFAEQTHWYVKEAWHSIDEVWKDP